MATYLPNLETSSHTLSVYRQVGQQKPWLIKKKGSCTHCLMVMQIGVNVAYEPTYHISTPLNLGTTHEQTWFLLSPCPTLS
jgi:hypothetical protein